jgi:hypothetical protein
MFKKYQKLQIIKPYGKGEYVFVYYLTDYISSVWSGNQIATTTKMIVEVIDTKELIHVEPSNIIQIIDGIT